MRLLISLLLTAAAHAALAPAQTEAVRGLLRDHKLSEAVAAANSLVAASPAEPEAYLLLGSVCIAKGDADAAVAAYEKATELVPKNGDYQRQLGDAYGLAVQTAGMFSKMSLGKKCLAAYEKAVELDPTNLTARSSLASMYQMAPGMMGGGIDKAYAQAAEIKKLDANRGRVAYAILFIGEKKIRGSLRRNRGSPESHARLLRRPLPIRPSCRSERRAHRPRHGRAQKVPHALATSGLTGARRRPMAPRQSLGKEGRQEGSPHRLRSRPGHQSKFPTGNRRAQEVRLSSRGPKGCLRSTILANEN